jgi:hypothetical protein
MVMGDTGPESLANYNKKTGISKTGDAESDATPAELKIIIQSWPTLPDPIRAAILAMVGSVNKGK